MCARNVRVGVAVTVRHRQTGPVLGATLTDGDKAGSYTKLPPSTLTLFDDKGKVIRQVPK